MSEALWVQILSKMFICGFTAAKPRTVFGSVNVYKWIKKLINGITQNNYLFSTHSLSSLRTP